MKTLILPVIVIAAIALIAKFTSARKAPASETKEAPVYSYGRKDFFMNRAEHEFFDVLVEVVGDSYYVFPQVHYPTILEHKVKGQDWNAAFRHIDEKSVDFVICDKAYIKPLVAIELDGKSHDTESVRLKDQREQSIFEGADMRLIRFANHGSPNKDEIRQRVFEALAAT